MLQFDSYTHNGYGHVMQDYAVTGKDCVVLADGCSSSQYSDVGARILCHAMKKIIEAGIAQGYTEFKDMLKWGIYQAVQCLGIDEEAFDSTLVALFKRDGFFHVYMYGDGNILHIDKNDQITIRNYQFNQNAPYYLSYLLNEERESIYLKSVNHVAKTLHTPVNEYITTLDPTSEISFSIPINDTNLLLIMSDGIESFSYEDEEMNRKLIHYTDICNDIIQFKNYTGEFIKRRMGSKRGLINEYEKLNIKHFDDISIAGVYSE